MFFRYFAIITKEKFVTITKFLNDFHGIMYETHNPAHRKQNSKLSLDDGTIIDIAQRWFN